MIRSEEEAIAVQKRRVKAGKHGVAKSVRRWIKRNKLHGQTGNLPVSWPAKSEATPKVAIVGDGAGLAATVDMAEIETRVAAIVTK